MRIPKTEVRAELKGLALGAAISVPLILVLSYVLPDRILSQNTRGSEHREFCERYCEEAEAILVEIENPRGAVVCHCVVPDME